MTREQVCQWAGDCQIIQRQQDRQPESQPATHACMHTHANTHTQSSRQPANDPWLQDVLLFAANTSRPAGRPRAWRHFIAALSGLQLYQKTLNNLAATSTLRTERRTVFYNKVHKCISQLLLHRFYSLEFEEYLFSKRLMLNNFTVIDLKLKDTFQLSSRTNKHYAKHANLWTLAITCLFKVNR